MLSEFILIAKYWEIENAVYFQFYYYDFRKVS